MTAPLHGLRVALLEAHLTDEAAAHVRRFGGVPYCVPAIREVRHLERVGLFIDRLSADRVHVVMFLTGVGATALLDEASRLGRLEETLAGLRRTTVACRGPKPVAVLRRHDVPTTVAAAEPYTSRQLFDALSTTALDGQDVALVRDGERNSTLAGALANALAARGARVEELWLYEWAMPYDLEPLNALVRELIAGRVDAIAFTNSIQGRHLFRAATDLGLAADLVNALNGDVLVAAVGPVCAESLQASGVTPNIIPARPTMESMIGALADYVELTGDSDR